RVVKPPTCSSVTHGVRSDLLHDYVYLCKLFLIKTETTRKPVHNAPRRAHVCVVSDFDRVNRAHKSRSQKPEERVGEACESRRYNSSPRRKTWDKNTNKYLSPARGD